MGAKCRSEIGKRDTSSFSGRSYCFFLSSSPKPQFRFSLCLALEFPKTIHSRSLWYLGEEGARHSSHFHRCKPRKGMVIDGLEIRWFLPKGIFSEMCVLCFGSSVHVIFFVLSYVVLYLDKTITSTCTSVWNIAYDFFNGINMFGSVPNVPKQFVRSIFHIPPQPVSSLKGKNVLWCHVSRASLKHWRRLQLLQRNMSKRC